MNSSQKAHSAKIPRPHASGFPGIFARKELNF